MPILILGYEPISIKNSIKTEKNLDSGSRKQAAIYAQMMYSI